METRDDYLRHAAYCVQRSELTKQPWIKMSYLAAAERWRGLGNPFARVSVVDPALFTVRAAPVSDVEQQYAPHRPPSSDDR